QSYSVRDVRWAAQTQLADGVLEVDRPALIAHLLEDSRLLGAELEIARPGESCRIGPVFDVLEPRAKLEGGSDYPGALGPMGSAVGEGISGRRRWGPGCRVSHTSSRCTRTSGQRRQASRSCTAITSATCCPPCCIRTRSWTALCCPATARLASRPSACRTTPP